MTQASGGTGYFIKESEHLVKPVDPAALEKLLAGLQAARA